MNDIKSTENVDTYRDKDSEIYRKNTYSDIYGEDTE